MFYFLKGVHKQMAASCGVPFGSALSLPHTGGWCCRNCLLSALTSGESLAGHRLIRPSPSQIIKAQAEERVGVEGTPQNQGFGNSCLQGKQRGVTHLNHVMLVDQNQMGGGGGFRPSSVFRSGD